MTDLDNAELRGTELKWENTMTDEKYDLVAEARVALAIKQAAEVCDAIRRAADEIVNAGADFQDYHSGKAWASEECHDTILALPHDPKALEAYVRERVNEALEKAANEIADYPRVAPDGHEAACYDDQIDYAQRIIRAMKEDTK
jgi:hypothetical protein